MKKRTALSILSLLISAMPLFSQTQKGTTQDFSAAVSRLDACVDNSLKTNNMTASGLSTDAVFLRRLSLDITGRQPSSSDAQKFIALRDPEKRSKKIDSLLDSDGFIEYQVLKWGDLLRCKSEFPSNLWPNAVQAYARWMKESIRDNIPYDQFVRELLISSGSNFRVTEVNFYRDFQTQELLEDPHDLIAKTFFSISNDETRSHLNGVLFECEGSGEKATARMVSTGETLPLR